VHRLRLQPGLRAVRARADPGYRFVGTSTWAPRRTNGAIYDTATFAVERVCAVD
jgi:hypothetical protein